jgi:uncharacterized protein (TIGR03032 family)
MTETALMNDQASTVEPQSSPTPYREVRFEYSAELPAILSQLGISLLVSTYQAGKLAVIGTSDGKVTFEFHQLDQAMGVAVKPRQIALGARRQVYFLQDVSELAATLEPRGSYDGCWVTRSSFFTGNVHGHEMAWGADGLWVVNTLFSTLCTLHDEYSFVPRWRPPFIRALAAEDRCHLNGLAMQNGQPKYVTALSETDEPAGWRPTKASSGCVIDVPSGETVARGLAMPHSPRIHDGRLWVLDSGRGHLSLVDLQSGRLECVEQMPGYTRGMSFYGPFAFVGLSRIRETSVFGGLPLEEQRDELRCGVGVIDLRIGRTVAVLKFLSGVEEIFAVEVLPGCQAPALFGPLPDAGASEQTGRLKDVWIVPPDGKVPPPTQDFGQVAGRKGVVSSWNGSPSST